jgi:hypothetical protein
LAESIQQSVSISIFVQVDLDRAQTGAEDFC